MNKILHLRSPMKASTKLLNQVNTYLFEQEFKELKNFTPVQRQKLKGLLKETVKILSDSIPNIEKVNMSKCPYKLYLETFNSKISICKLQNEPVACPEHAEDCNVYLNYENNS